MASVDGGPWLPHVEVDLGADAAPTMLRVAVMAVGVVLLTRGTWLGRDSVRFAAGGTGVLFGVVAIEMAGAPSAWLEPSAYAGVLLLTACAALWVERLIGMRISLGLTGFLTGAAIAAAACKAIGVDPWPVPMLVTGGTALLVLPWIFETFPRALTPAVAAVVTAWTLGLADSLPAVVGLWAVGITAQLFTGPEAIDLHERGSQPAR